MVADKTYKLELFKQVLPAIDKRKFDFYSGLNDDQKTGFSPIVALRAMSVCSENDREMGEYVIFAANEANKHFWNSQIAKKHDLQYLILASMGIGAIIKHKWIKGPSSVKKRNKVLDVLSKYYPLANTEELLMFVDINDLDSLIEIGKMLGLQVDAMKEYTTEIKKIKNEK